MRPSFLKILAVAFDFSMHTDMPKLVAIVTMTGMLTDLAVSPNKRQNAAIMIKVSTRAIFSFVQTPSVVVAIITSTVTVMMTWCSVSFCPLLLSGGMVWGLISPRGVENVARSSFRTRCSG